MRTLILPLLWAFMGFNTISVYFNTKMALVEDKEGIEVGTSYSLFLVIGAGRFWSANPFLNL